MYRSSIVVSILPTSTGTCTVGTSYLLLHRCMDTRYGMSLKGEEVRFRCKYDSVVILFVPVPVSIRTIYSIIALYLHYILYRVVQVSYLVRLRYNIISQNFLQQAHNINTNCNFFIFPSF